MVEETELNKKLKNFKLNKTRFRFNDLYKAYFPIIKERYSKKLDKLKNDIERLEGLVNKSRIISLKEQIRELKRDFNSKHSELKSVINLHLSERLEKPCERFEDIQYVIPFEALGKKYELGVFESYGELKLDIEKYTILGWNIVGKIITIEDINEKVIKESLRGLIKTIIDKDIL